MEKKEKEKEREKYKEKEKEGSDEEDLRFKSWTTEQPEQKNQEKSKETVVESRENWNETDFLVGDGEWNVFARAVKSTYVGKLFFFRKNSP